MFAFDKAPRIEGGLKLIGSNLFKGMTFCENKFMTYNCVYIVNSFKFDPNAELLPINL
jgi:hypothetical protein